MNPIQEVIQGFSGGFFAGITGYVLGIMTSTIFEASTFFSPLIPILGFIFSIITFFTGISEAQITGLFFSIVITTAGIVLSDFVIVISGSISIAGLILGWLKK